MDLGLVGDLRLHQGRAHVAGVDAVGRDPVSPALQRRHLTQPFKTVLGGNVGALERGGPEPVHRREVDDPAEVVRIHVWQRRPDQQEGRLQHEGDKPAEIGRLEVLNRADALDSGVVDQDVAVQAGGCQGIHIQQVHCPDGTAHFIGKRCCGGLVDVRDHHFGAPFGEGPHTGCADGAGSSGDQSLAAVQRVFHIQPSCSNDSVQMIQRAGRLQQGWSRPQSSSSACGCYRQAFALGVGPVNFLEGNAFGFLEAQHCHCGDGTRHHQVNGRGDP
ncbi:hypothetical protein D9M72_483840 [compost metagenome]